MVDRALLQVVENIQVKEFVCISEYALVCCITWYVYTGINIILWTIKGTKTHRHVNTKQNQTIKPVGT